MSFYEMIKKEYKDLVDLYGEISEKMNFYIDSDNSDSELYLKLSSELFVLQVKIECLRELLNRYNTLKFDDAEKRFHRR